MIQNIVFDMGWVLVEYKPLEYIREYLQDENDIATMYQKMFNAPEWLENDRGTISREDFINLVCARIPERLHPAAKQIWEHWVEYIKPIAETNELAAELKEKGYRIYLLSNVSERYYSFRKLIPALPYFDGEFVSADVHFIKPEKEIYELFFQRFGLNPQECFFIDDRAENVAAGEQFGMPGFCYQQDVQSLKLTLRGAGIRI
jgi:putative hydrolase of the HAD superfamily